VGETTECTYDEGDNLCDGTSYRRANAPVFLSHRRPITDQWTPTGAIDLMRKPAAELAISDCIIKGAAPPICLSGARE
jgi:hypothetical protein